MTGRTRAGKPAQRASVRGLKQATERGGRVFLRAATARDREEFVALRRASASFHRPWDPRPPKGVDMYGPAGFERYLKRSREEASDYSLVCRLDDGAILGSVNLSQIMGGPFQCAFLGYWMGKPHAGQGYMSQGLQLALRRAFRTLDLHRVEANIRPDNAPSLALVARAGFRKEGYSPRYLKIAGRWHDHERWALLREHWRARAGTGAPPAASASGDYATEQRVTIAEAPGLRVRLLALGKGQCVPWHLHTQITDTFFCMEGPMQVETRGPQAEHVLGPGGSFAVPPNTPHYVAGVADGPCRFMIVQGEGVYDYVSLEP